MSRPCDGLCCLLCCPVELHVSAGCTCVMRNTQKDSSFPHATLWMAPEELICKAAAAAAASVCQDTSSSTGRKLQVNLQRRWRTSCATSLHSCGGRNYCMFNKSQFGHPEQRSAPLKTLHTRSDKILTHRSKVRLGEKTPVIMTETELTGSLTLTTFV